MVPPCSDRVSRVPPYLICNSSCFAYGAITLYGCTFQSIPLQLVFSAGPLSLAATQGISVDFFSSGYLDVSVPRVCLCTLCIQIQIPQKRWVSPFGNPRIKASLTTNRGLSQSTTSFIAFYRLGIRHVRLITWPYNPKQSLHLLPITLHSGHFKVLRKNKNGYTAFADFNICNIPLAIKKTSY